MKANKESDALFSEHQRTLAVKRQRGPLEAWVIVDSDGYVLGPWLDRESAKRNSIPTDRIVRLREVVEEEE